MIETQLVTLPTTKAHLYFGLRMGADMYLQKQVEELKKKFPDTFIFTYCLSRESEDVKVEGGQIYKGHIQDALEIFWKDNVISSYEYYICGSKPAVEAIKDYVFQKGAHADKIFFERFTL